jgi:uncharacterized protein
MCSLEQAKIFTDLLVREFGDRLVSVVLFGSVARGTAGPDSDIDLMLVLKGLSPGRYQRRQVLDHVLNPWESDPHNARINAHLRTPEEAQQRTVLYYDFPDEAILLFDRNGFFKNIIKTVAEHIQKQGATRKRWGKHYYWDLKPGAHSEDIFDIL